MKLKKIGLFFVLSLLFSLSLICASTTTININSLKDYNLTIMVNVLDPLPGTAFQSFEEYSNFQEELTFTFTGDVSRIGISAMAQKSGLILASKRFGNFSTGGTINLELFEQPNTTQAVSTGSVLTGNVIETLNETENSTLSTIDNSGENRTLSPVQETSININWKKIFLWIGIVIGAIIVLAILVVVVMFIIKFIKKKETYGSNLFSSSSDKDVVIDEKTRKELLGAERKIKEAQETIDYIKNKKQKVDLAQKKFEDAKRELERLKGN